ncbi:hypothetical protein BT93_K0758 [Corymbia citriodora subsp. variegata]|nr:hypothetical protein BT93_K0758 [Corymbia citriodora subsp. variegata]
MNQDESCEKRCSEICQKIFRAICQVARGGQAPNSAHSEADPSFNAVKIQSISEGGHRITLVRENGQAKFSTSNFPDYRVPIFPAPTGAVKTPGSQGSRQSANGAVITGAGLPVQGSGLEKTQPGSIPVGRVHQVTVTNGGRVHKPKLESTLSANQPDMDRRFSDYINRTWLKIRSMSNVGTGKDHVPLKDTGHNHYEDHNTQAKKKPRTTSGISGGSGGRGLSAK